MEAILRTWAGYRPSLKALPLGGGGGGGSRGNASGNRDSQNLMQYSELYVCYSFAGVIPGRTPMSQLRLQSQAPTTLNRKPLDLDHGPKPRTLDLHLRPVFEGDGSTPIDP